MADKKNVDRKLKELAKCEGTKAVIAKWFPMPIDSPMAKMAYGMTMTKVLTFPQIEMSDEDKAKFVEELNAVDMG